MNSEPPQDYLEHLRSSIILHPQSDDQDHAILEDVAKGRFFRIGASEELFLLQLLEGNSIEDTIQNCGLSEGHVQELCSWLNSIGLLPSPSEPKADNQFETSGIEPSSAPPPELQEPTRASASSTNTQHQASIGGFNKDASPRAATLPVSAEGPKRNSPPPAAVPSAAVPRTATRDGSASDAPATASSNKQETPPAKPPNKLVANLFFSKIPLFNPDSFLAWLVNRIGWLFSWQSAILACFLLTIAGLATLGSWQDFLSNYENLMAPGRWLTLALGWLLLKIVHEIGHAATCKRYGGKVPKAGLALILFMPIAFVDVTSSWQFNSKWKRIHVALGGVLAEAYVACIALFGWQYTDSLLLKQMAADVALLATVSSALFNLNPLLKFDGYFVLADFTGRHNLYQTGQKYARYFGARYLLGIASEKQARGLNQETTWVKLYALSAACWRTVTLVGLMTAASIMFEGAGIILALIGFCTFVFSPLKALLRYLAKQAEEANLAMGPVVLRFGLMSFAAIGLAFVIPADLQQATPGIVEYDPPSILRAPTEGFIDKVYATNGQFVEEGQPLFEIRNDNLKVEWFQLEKEYRLVQQAVRSARWTNDTAKLTEAMTELEGVATKLKELQRSMEDLTVRSPVSGRLVARGLKNSEGKFYSRGDEIGAVGSEERKRLKLSLSQWDASKAQSLTEQRVVVSVLGQWSWRDIISSVESRASEIPPDPSLTVPSGGVLAVLKTEGDEPVLCSPRVTAYITLDQNRSLQLRCGQRCWVALPVWKKSWGHKALEALHQTLPDFSGFSSVFGNAR